MRNELKSYEIAINCLVDVEDRSTFEVWVKMATRDNLNRGIEYCVSKGILKRKEIFNLIWEVRTLNTLHVEISKAPLFNIFYQCPKCGNEWDEVFSSPCDSECGKCDTGNITAKHFVEIT